MELDRWQANTGSFRCYGAPGELTRACYHAPSGDLHLLEPVPARVLALLVEEGPLESGEILVRLREEFAFDGGINLPEWVDRILHDLARHQLIFPVEPLD